MQKHRIEAILWHPIVEVPVNGQDRAVVSGGGWMLPIISNGQKIHWPEQKIIINDAVFASC